MTVICFCSGAAHIPCCSEGRSPGIFHKRCCGDPEAIVAEPPMRTLSPFAQRAAAGTLPAAAISGDPRL